jgi:HEAT repeat protein
MRRLLVACACSTLVPLVSMSGSLTPPVGATPFAAVEAPAGTPGIQGASSPGAAALPVVSSRLERRDASAGLRAVAERVMASTPGPAWLAWTVRVVDKEHEHRFDSRREAACVLDDDGHLRSGSNTTGDTTSIVVLARFTARAIDRVAFTDARCVVQAGARPVYWMDGASAKDSVGLLADVAARPDGGEHHVRQGALAALAMTDDPSADAALARFVEAAQPPELRRDAAFWLGAARGAAGARVVDRLVTTDRDPSFREHLTFVLSLTGAAGLDRLIDLAKHDAEPDVRRQALFWLSQKAGERAAGTISKAADDDPDLEVRKHAVFAMSQLPKDEGVPRLVTLARTHRDREVRKQAMFWLGQSGDPRALALFEQVLKP